MPLWNHDLCKDVHDFILEIPPGSGNVIMTIIKISDGMLCAGEPAGGVDTCGVSWAVSRVIVWTGIVGWLV